MLETIVDNHLLFYLLGAAGIIGFISKCVVNFTLKRLIRAAGDMGKSTHSLMKLVRAKFEHACMVSDKVQNIEAFVEKYLYEYRVLGLRVHSWRQMEKVSMWLCGISGGLGALLRYRLYGMDELVFQYASVGMIVLLLLLLLFIGTDEEYQMEVIANYMVDYLENVCLRRYEKAAEQEKQIRREAVSRVKPVERKEEDVEKKTERLEEQVFRAAEEMKTAAFLDEEEREPEPERDSAQEIKIREILESFLA